MAPSRLLAGLCHVFLVLFMVHAGKLEQVINFTIMGGTAKHCIDQYVVLFRYSGVTLLCRVGYMLGFVTYL